MALYFFAQIQKNLPDDLKNAVLCPDIMGGKNFARRVGKRLLPVGTSDKTELSDMKDELCAEHKLMMLKKPKGKTPHKLYFAEKNGEPTQYNLMWEAIDRVLTMSTHEKTFCYVRRRLEYLDVTIEGKPNRAEQLRFRQEDFKEFFPPRYTD